MTRNGYHYTFAPEIRADIIENLMHLAILSATALHGQAAVRLDVRYNVDHEKRSCMIDARTQVGIDLNRLFVGYANEELGKDAFSVQPRKLTEASC